MRAGIAVVSLLVLLGAVLLAVMSRPAAPPVPPPPVTLAAAVPTAMAASRIHFPPDQMPRLALGDGRMETVRSLLNVDRTLHYGDYRWNEQGVAQGPVWIRVDLARQMLSVFRAGHEIGTAVILYGVDGNPTPTGLFPILAKAKVHRSSIYDADMPYMQRLTGDGVAIHATDVRAGFASRGCIGVPLPFAQKLFAATRIGDLVAILPEQPGKPKKHG